MFKDLLVATTGHGDDAAAFSAACALALPADGHVAILVQVPAAIPEYGGVGLFPVDAFVALHDQLHRAGVADCERWREILRRSGAMGEVRLSEDTFSSPAETAALQARYADITLIGLGVRGALPAEVHDMVAKVLSGSGRPLLVVPQGCRTTLPFRIAVAWRPGAGATRAVHDALPLLAKATAVDIICVDPRQGEGRHGEDPGTDIARHLARHDVAVTVNVVAGSGGEPGAAFLQRTRELGANMLVMGGYGHSRLREWVLGGTTRYVLQHATLPVLLAH